jgi:nitronate monooxygenase
MTQQHLLGTDLALTPAPMTGVQGSALVVAVSNAGALCRVVGPGDGG